MLCYCCVTAEHSRIFLVADEIVVDRAASLPECPPSFLRYNLPSYHPQAVDTIMYNVSKILKMHGVYEVCFLYTYRVKCVVPVYKGYVSASMV